MPIVLASKSPRRLSLLEALGVSDIKVIPAVGREVTDPGLPPEEQAKGLSLAKAEEVAMLCSADDIIIAADTLVVIDGDIFGKPEDKKEAAEMLSALSGRSHRVYTGVTVKKGDTRITEAEVTVVRFRELSLREIEAYVESGDPFDKAGAYGIQSKGALFVESINGDFYNVMGLPLCRLGIMLKKLGVNLI